MMWRAFQRIPARRLLAWLLALICLPPLLMSLILVLMDSIRKHTRSQGHFLSLRNEPPVHVGDTEVQFYTYGNDLYRAMLAAIRHARQRILFETFIWKDDTIGDQFKQALTEAARRGVEVYIIYDSFANLVVSRSFFQFDPAIRVLPYPLFSFPFRFFQLKTYARDHRKLLIVDSQIGFIGGYNIGDFYARHWRDTHVRLVGPGALEIENIFIDFWNEHRKKQQPELPDVKKRDWSHNLAIQRNDPVLLMFPIRSMYLEAIDRAQSSFYLTTAYFIPDRGILYALIKAVKRGVDVRILVPAVSNHIIADWLSHGFYTQCLKHGIRVLLYADAMIHAKTATADGQWSTVGTANVDRLSMVGNFEVNVEFYNQDAAREMEKIFEYDAARSHELTLQQWSRRPIYWKIGEYMLYLLRPLF
ncbi:phospholipase D-like domain-containing protein [Dictyobacter aurantiacus]|uniref:Cardiolipin synthase n=1 Tax=Dictyobacter aurantiacus TaxID=1936993 RepID=A0A401ZIM4_9CHLR|nr:phospholipase D-like domain-containing protein [Dictyobacter aurantiacus]GCE06711.1 cardiolipin synthase [Dictyobacter aurantiacus]